MIQMHSAYAAIYNNDAIRMASSSGGIFTLIAEDVLSRGGVVFGAAVTEDLRICHICVETPDQLARLRGSKYVRSHLGQVYAQAKAFLEAGRPVLFTGTPCQIGGLRQYLKQDYDHLLCQDLICHGTPMAQVWEKYVRYREKIAGAKATSVNFRDKHTGWLDFSLSMTFTNGTVYRQPLSKDPYLRVFLKDLCLSSSCYQCSFKGLQRQADITLADFWGVQQLLPKMHDNKGTSLLFVHTPKGQALLQRLSPKLTLAPADTQAALAWNPAMLRSATRPQNADNFLQALTEDNFEQLANRYCPPPSLLDWVVKKIKRVLRKIIKHS